MLSPSLNSTTARRRFRDRRFAQSRAPDLLGLFPCRGLPFRNEALVEHPAVRREYKYADALALLDGTGQDLLPMSHCYQRQRHVTPAHLDGMKFEPKSEVARRLVFVLEANDPPVHQGAFRHQGADRIQQSPFNRIAGKRTLRVDVWTQCNLNCDSRRDDYGRFQYF